MQVYFLYSSNAALIDAIAFLLEAKVKNQLFFFSLTRLQDHSLLVYFRKRVRWRALQQ